MTIAQLKQITIFDMRFWKMITNDQNEVDHNKSPAPKCFEVKSLSPIPIECVYPHINRTEIIKTIKSHLRGNTESECIFRID